MMKPDRERVGEYVGGSLWLGPFIAIVLALALGSLLSQVEVAPGSALSKVAFQGTADDARQILIVVSATMITVTGLVFSLTVVALQIASGQFSPRLLRNFLRDGPNKVVLSIFVGTFAYATAGLYTVGVSGGSRSAGVPRLAVSGALVLAFFSLAALVWFLHHLARSIQIDVILQTAERRTMDVVGDLPDRTEAQVHAAPPPPRGAQVVRATRSGYLQTAHPERLLPVAVEHDVVIRLLPFVGNHVIGGHAVARVWAEGRELTSLPPAVDRAVASALIIGGERTLQQDVAFGLRQIVDIALRALSPAVNDPYTAAMAVNRLTVVLCALARHPLGDDLRRDTEGTVRVALPMRTFEEFLALCCNQIRRYGAADPRVLEALLDLLSKVASDTSDLERRAMLAQHVRLVIGAAEGAVRQQEDLATLRAVGEALITRFQTVGGGDDGSEELSWVRVS